MGRNRFEGDGMKQKPIKIVLHIIHGKVYEGVQSIFGKECTSGCALCIDGKCQLEFCDIRQGCMRPEMEGRNYKLTTMQGPKCQKT
jgi:hypothetical protein